MGTTVTPVTEGKHVLPPLTTPTPDQRVDQVSAQWRLCAASVECATWVLVASASSFIQTHLAEGFLEALGDGVAPWLAWRSCFTRNAVHLMVAAA